MSSTSSQYRRQLPDASLYSHPSSFGQSVADGVNIKSPWANRGRALGWPTSLDALIARWCPESIESNGSYMTWGDVSGHGYHINKSSSFPTLAVGLMNRNCLQCSASDLRADVLPKHLINGLTQFAFFAVVKTPASAQSLQSFFGGSSFGGTTTNMFNVELNSGSYPCQFLMRNEWGDDAATSATSTLTAASSVAASTWYSLLFNFDGTNIQAYINGASSGSATTPAGKGRLYHAAALKMFGTNYSGGNFWWQGSIHEIALFGKGLTSGQRTDLFAYSLASYGL